MAELNFEPMIKKITEAQLEDFKERIRQLQAVAWEEGYTASEDDKYKEDNPYLKENDNA
jgi:hypothetical protein